MVRNGVNRFRRNYRITKPEADQCATGNQRGKVHRIEIAEHQHHIFSMLRASFEITRDLRTRA